MANKLSAAIPGENYTSNTKNYPWHRPPKFDTLEECVSYTMDNLSNPKHAKGLLTMLEIGMPITFAVDTIVTAGIGSGKWTPDQAILMAGPVARFIEIMAKGAGIDYTLGLDTKDNVPSADLLKFLSGVDSDDVSDEEVAGAVEAAEEAMEAPEEMGIMSPNLEREQEMMLGAGDEEETDIEQGGL